LEPVWSLFGALFGALSGPRKCTKQAPNSSKQLQTTPNKLQKSLKNIVGVNVFVNSRARKTSKTPILARAFQVFSVFLLKNANALTKPAIFQGVKPKKAILARAFQLFQAFELTKMRMPLMKLLVLDFELQF